MNRLKLGNTDIEVSALCYGTDLIGSRIDQNDSLSLLDLFHQQGGNFIDTANFYASWLEGCQGGESESTIGSWMADRGNRDAMVIASKLGFDYPGCEGGLTADQIETECEKSLARLQTDRIDLYYAHVDDPDTPLEETMHAFDRLVQAGKVRAIGASNLRGWRIAEANLLSQLKGWSPYVAIEQRYTYLRPRHGASFGPQLWMENGVRHYSRAHGLTAVGYSILLQGTYTRDDRPVPQQFAGPDTDERLTVLRDVAAEVEATPNQVIIAWMRQSDPPVLPIIAGSRIEQVQENIDALKVTLSDEQMRRLNTAGDPEVKNAWLR